MMLQSSRRLLLICLVCLLLFVPLLARAQQESVVRALLFYSPTCSHCHTVINEVLLPMVEEYGERLQIVAVDVTQDNGQALYQSAIDHFQIPEERLGVPTLIVGETVLVGSGEIPDQFPDIASAALATGIDWPAVPGFVPPEEFPDQAPEPTMAGAPQPTDTPKGTATARPTATAAPTEEPAAGLAASEGTPPSENRPAVIANPEPFILDVEQAEMPLVTTDDPPADPLGFALASTILVAMVIACAYVAWRLASTVTGWRRTGRMAGVPNLSRAIPLIALLGIAVAAYLAYVDLNQVEAICGPVGHCNLVQSSPHARIMGIPIALLGIATYLTIIGLWFVQRVAIRRHDDSGSNSWPRWTLPGLVGLTIFGTLFSIYLTLLELFVIRAVCAWCLTSAVTMMALMLLAVRPLTTRPILALR